MRKQKPNKTANFGSQENRLAGALAPAGSKFPAIDTASPAAPATDEPTNSNQPAGKQTIAAVPASHSGLVFPPRLNMCRTVRRAQLREIVPLADTTIYEMEQHGDFPRRFYLTPRCVVWDLGEVEAWVAARRQASATAKVKRAPTPDVRRRRTRPVTR